METISSVVAFKWSSLGLYGWSLRCSTATFKGLSCTCTLPTEHHVTLLVDLSDISLPGSSCSHPAHLGQTHRCTPTPAVTLRRRLADTSTRSTRLAALMQAEVPKQAREVDREVPHRMKPLQAAVAQEQQLRLAALQLRNVVHLAKGARLVNVRVLDCTAAGARAAKGAVSRCCRATQLAALPYLIAIRAAITLAAGAAAAASAKRGPC